MDAARAALVGAGFDPRPVTEGSRRTPEGDTVAWRVCDVGPGPYDAGLPFLIEWTTPMPAGPADGPVVAWVTLAPPDPDRVAALLLARGAPGAAALAAPRVPRPAGVGITLLPVEAPAAASAAADGAAYASLAVAGPTPSAAASVVLGCRCRRWPRAPWTGTP